MKTHTREYNNGIPLLWPYFFFLIKNCYEFTLKLAYVFPKVVAD